MKYIIAVVQPTRLEAVKEALSHIEVFRLTVSDVQGIGRQKGHTELYRGHEYQISLVRKVKIEIAVDDKYVEPTIDAICKAAKTGDQGKIGDGKIFVLPMDDVVRIRTRERGTEAI
jgi:nitrogen regulatory protein P-II 2